MLRFSGIFFLLLLLFNISGAYLVFSAQEIQFKEQAARLIHAGITAENVAVLRFPAKQTLQWTEEKKEFRYKDAMYDVISSQKQGDSVVYYCYSDNDETHLFAWLNDVLQNGDQTIPSPSAASLVKMMDSVVYLPVAKPVLGIQNIITLPEFTAAENDYVAPSPGILCPPPQIV